MTVEKNKGRFAILLSTFNGASHLPELLESLELQTYPDWDLWVRDDGSDDETYKLLEAFQEKLKLNSEKNRVFLKKGKNVGVVSGFYLLAKEVEGVYEGYAFCDQDDIWLPFKLERAADYFRRYGAFGLSRPFLYHARQYLWDDKSGKTALSSIPKKPGFSNALIQNQVTGCTMVINPVLKEAFFGSFFDKKATEESSEEHHIRGKNPKKTFSSPFDGIILHDWWCYLIASAYGEVVFDSKAVIRFRRHSRTSTPASAGWFTSRAARISTLKKRTWKISHIIDQAKLFSRYYHTDAPLSADFPLSREKMGSLKQLLHLEKAFLKGRLHYLFAGKHHRNTLPETLIFRLMILFRRF